MNSGILNSILNSIKFINEKILTLSNKIYEIITNLQNNYVTNTKYTSDKTNAPIICKLINSYNNNNTYIIQEKFLSIIYLFNKTNNISEYLYSNFIYPTNYIKDFSLADNPINDLTLHIHITVPIGKLVKIYNITSESYEDAYNMYVDYKIELLYILDNTNSNQVPLINSNSFNNEYFDVNLAMCRGIGVIICAGIPDEIDRLVNSSAMSIRQ
jgi:hypothetical protein